MFERNYLISDSSFPILSSKDHGAAITITRNFGQGNGIMSYRFYPIQEKEFNSEFSFLDTWNNGWK